MRIDGVVCSGLGRAHIFMSQHHYQEQFKNILGRSAWPGTLNVSVEGKSLINYQKLRVSAGLDEELQVQLMRTGSRGSTGMVCPSAVQRHF